MALNNLVGISLERISVDYIGDIAPESPVKDCIHHAEELLKNFNQ